MTIAQSEKHDIPLVMTAAIDPQCMQGLSVTAVSERAKQYLVTLYFYLSCRLFAKIVFVENSGHNLSDFEKMAASFPLTKVEFISCDLNNYPRNFGKSYGEMQLLDYVVDNSTVLKAVSEFIKVTGRFSILNIATLLMEAKHRRPWDLFCDCKDHCIYNWLRLGWNGHSADTRFFIVNTDFYRRHFYGRYHELDDSQGKLVEGLFFRVAREQSQISSVVSRFRTEPVYSGKAGHIQVSCIGTNDYSGHMARTKRVIRQIARHVCPWFWF